MKKIYELDTNLRIGPSCVHMNISGILECVDAMYLSLGYTNLDFIYNKESFTAFDDEKEPEHYISKENDLIIACDIDSKYAKDWDCYMDLFSEYIYKPDVQELKLQGIIDWVDLKAKYLDNNIPIMYVCDHYYNYEDYKKVVNDMEQFHTSGHMAILFEIDLENQIAYVVDKFYGFKGKLHLDNLKKSIESEHLHTRKFNVLKLDNLDLLNESEGFQKYLYKNFNVTMQKEIELNNRKYHKNRNAVKGFCEDFFDNVKILYDKKGKYAPQFLSKLISSTILQKSSFLNLLQYYMSLKENEAFNRLHNLTQKSMTLWNRIDQYNDKVYLSQKSILDKTKMYKVLLDELLETDLNIYNLMESADS